jgi:hypothetical protein
VSMPADVRERVTEELKEVNGRLEKLTAFLGKEEKEPTLGLMVLRTLAEQEYHMRKYVSLLQFRLKYDD